MSTVRNQPGKQTSTSEGKRPAREKSEQAVDWSRWVRIVVSLLILWHLFAVFIGPFSVPPSSETISNLAFSKYVRWYTDPLYLNHGYHFFAPNPSASHVVRFLVVDPRGETLAEGQFPNLREYWPRLLYHRYLMLADQAFTPPIPGAEENAQARTRFILQRYALHLLDEYDGERARVELLRHDLLTPAQLEEKGRLDDPSTFVSEMIVEQSATDLKLVKERREQAKVSPSASDNRGGAS